MSTDFLVKERSNIKIKEPRKYNVVMYNDDFTTMEFVVFILVSIFNKNNEEAVNIMMTVHKGGKAIVGSYTYDIANSKVEKALALAKAEGFPFKVKVEEV